MKQKIAKRRAYLNERKQTGKRLTIGFTGIADFRSFIGQEYIAGIIKAAEDYDVNFINMSGAIKYSLFDDIDFFDQFMKKFKFMKAPFVDGMVIWASSLCVYLPKADVITTFQKLKPLPMVDIGYLDIPDIPSIRIDNEYSMSLLIDHLYKVHGYKKFAFIGCADSQTHIRRLAMYHEELRKRELEELPNTVYMINSMEVPDIAECISKLGTHYALLNQDIDVIVTASDIIASIAIDELYRKGIQVPDCISVTGYNNQYNGITARSPITTINLEYYRRGYSAVELLIDRIINPEVPSETILIPTSLVIRQSCGCFEKEIMDADLRKIPEIIIPKEEASVIEVQSCLMKQISEIFVQETSVQKEKLINAIFSDVYEQETPPALLKWFRTAIHKTPHIDRSEIEWQQIVSRLKNIVMQIANGNTDTERHMENVFHQIRVLVSVSAAYNLVSRQSDFYWINDMTHIAILFASALSSSQIYDTLKNQLGEMGIPGIILALSDNLYPDFGTASVVLVHPAANENIVSQLPFRVKDPVLFPKTFFSTRQRYSLVLEILYHAGNYLGYAFFYSGTPNIAVYDAIRMLLSNAFYAVYLNEGKTGDRVNMLSRTQITNLLHLKETHKTGYTQKGLTVQKITDYLLDHINEMTNLDKMASTLMVSKSSLVQQTKRLTGFTVQTLHERIKIEQAKNLLKVKSLKLEDIATRLGFQNQNYFSYVFKKVTGLSPRNWLT